MKHAIVLKALTPLPILIGLLVAPAHATIVFTSGNNPQPDEQNVLYGSSQSGSTVTGRTNQTNTSVNFTSSTDTLVETAQGQANLTALDGLINQVTISVPGQTFGDMILNPF